MGSLSSEFPGGARIVTDMIWIQDDYSDFLDNASTISASSNSSYSVTGEVSPSNSGSDDVFGQFESNVEVHVQNFVQTNMPYPERSLDLASSSSDENELLRLNCPSDNTDDCYEIYNESEPTNRRVAFNENDYVKAEDGCQSVQNRVVNCVSGAKLDTNDNIQASSEQSESEVEPVELSEDLGDFLPADVADFLLEQYERLGINPFDSEEIINGDSYVEKYLIDFLQNTNNPNLNSETAVENAEMETKSSMTISHNNAEILTNNDETVEQDGRYSQTTKSESLSRNHQDVELERPVMMEPANGIAIKEADLATPEIEVSMPVLISYSAKKIAEEAKAPPMLEPEEPFRKTGPLTSRLNGGRSGPGRFEKKIPGIQSDSSHREPVPKRRRTNHSYSPYCGTLNTDSEPQLLSPEAFKIFKTDLMESIKNMRPITKQKMSLRAFNSKVLSAAIGLNINVKSLPTNLIQILANEYNFDEIGIGQLISHGEGIR